MPETVCCTADRYQLLLPGLSSGEYLWNPAFCMLELPRHLSAQRPHTSQTDFNSWLNRIDHSLCVDALYEHR